MGRMHEHRGLSGMIQVACPLAEHRDFDQFGDMMFEFRRCLRLIGVQTVSIPLSYLSRSSVLQDRPLF